MRARAAQLAEPPNALTLLLVGVLAVVVWHNAFTYPSVSGPDAEPDIAYAQTIVNEWRIPTAAEVKSYYTPPGFFLLAGGMIKLGEALGAIEPAQYGQLLNGILTLATALLLAALCALVFPGRPWLRVAALGLFVACPVVLKTGAMFHPQPLVAFLATLAMVIAARMIGQRRYGLATAIVLGLVVGAGQLVRSAGIWTLGVVIVALLATAIACPAERRGAVRALAVVAIIGLLVPLPWYVYLQTRYSNPIFGRTSAPLSKTPSASLLPGRSAAPAAFRLVATNPLPTRHTWFYVDPGLPEIVTAPQRTALVPAFWPILFTDTWGDYSGIWKWGSIQKPLTPSTENRLTVQTIVGVLPTFLTTAGLFALCALAVARVRSRPELVLVPLMPLVALAGTLYYAVSYPTVDADTVKALYLLPAVPAFAVCFGFAVETLWRRSRWLGIAIVVPLAAGLLVSLAFGVA